MFSRYLFADTFYDLYAGRLIVTSGLPHVNVATVAAKGTAWTDQQWLAQSLYYLTWRAGGYRLLAAFSAVLVTSGFAIFARLMIRRGVPPSRAFAWTLVAFAVCMGNTGIRAQSFAYPCFAATLWLVLDDAEGHQPTRAPRPATWLLIPVLVLWANTHGSVLLGALLAGGYGVVCATAALTRRDQKSLTAAAGYLTLGGAAVASVACTPYGTGVFGYYLRFEHNPVLRHDVAEWAPPDPRSTVSLAFFAAVLLTAGCLVLAWRRGARPDPVIAACAVVSLALAFAAVRNQAWFGFCGALLAADTLARAGVEQVPRLHRNFERVVLVTLTGLAVAALAVLAATTDGQFYSQTPVAAISAAAAEAGPDRSVRVLGDDYSGTAMLWLEPSLFGRVGFDDRFEEYTPAELRAYVDFLFPRGPGWQRVTRGYSVIVASARHPALILALSRLPGWRVTYRDTAGIVLTRQGCCGRH